MTEAADLLIRIEASTAMLRQQLAQSDQLVQRTTKSMAANLLSVDGAFDKLNRSTNMLKGALGALGVGLSVAALTAYGKRALDVAAGLGEIASQAGVTTRTLQVLQFASVQTGVKQEQLVTSLGRLSTEMGRAARGSQEQVKRFREIGVAVRDADGQLRSTEAVFLDIATAIQRAQTPAERSAIAFNAFGEAGNKLMPILESGAEGFREMEVRAQAAGFILDDVLIGAADDASDKLATMAAVLERNVARVVISLTPQIASLSAAITAAIPNVAAFLERFTPEEFLPADALQGRVDDLRFQIEALDRAMSDEREERKDGLMSESELADILAVLDGNKATVAARVEALEKLIEVAKAREKIFATSFGGGDGGGGGEPPAVRKFADTLKMLGVNYIEASDAALSLAEAEAIRDRMIEAGLTEQEKYARQVDSLNAALTVLREAGVEPTAAAIAAMNRALEATDPAVKAAKAEVQEYLDLIDELAKAEDQRIGARDKAAGQAARDASQLLLNLEFGSTDNVLDAVGKLSDSFAEIEANSNSTGEALATFGQALIDTGAAAEMAASVLGMALGRTQEQNRNAKLGGKIGGVAGQAIGTAIGGPVGGKIGEFVGTVGGNLLGGTVGMSKGDIRAARAAAEWDALSKSIEQFVAASIDLGPTASRLDQLRQQFDGLAAEAIRLGKPIDDLTRAYERQAEAVRRAANDANQARLFENTGLGGLAELLRLQQAQDAAIKDAIAAELDLDLARRANAAELRAFFEEFSYGQLVTMGELVTQLDLVKARIRDLTGGIGTQIDAMSALAQDAARLATSQADSLRRASETLRRQIDGYRVGAYASPTERLAEAQVQFQRVWERVQAGDIDAINELGGVADQYREIARAFYASGEDFQAVDRAIQAALSQAADMSDSRATEMERISALAEQQVQLLGSLRDILERDLGQPTADAVAAAIADSTLTVAETGMIVAGLDTVAQEVAGATGVQADALRSSIGGLQAVVQAGNLSAIPGALDAFRRDVDAFRSSEVQRYAAALSQASDAIAAVGSVQFGDELSAALQGLVGGTSPLVSGVHDLTRTMAELGAALASQGRADAAMSVQDRGASAFTAPFRQAGASAASGLASILVDEASGSKNNRSNRLVDATTGALTSLGGNAENSDSRQRAADLAAALATITRTLEQLTGGDISNFQVQAAERASGYAIGSINKLSGFAGNDFAGIGRAFVTDALSAISGGDAGAIDILRRMDWSNLSAGFASAADAIYRARNPIPGFADGGMFGGGLRLVGERGPELEVTGPARYFSTMDTARMLRGVNDSAAVDELRALRAEVAGLRQENKALMQMQTAELVKPRGGAAAPAATSPLARRFAGTAA